MNGFCISIVIPTFNRADIIGATLESVINQTYTDWDCIVVDDGSSDHTEQVVLAYIKNYRNIRYLSRNRLPKGVSTSRNIGLEKALGDYILFLDSDDLLAPECLENRMAYAKQNPDCDFWVFKMQQFEIDFKNKTHIKNNFTLHNSSSEYLSLFLKGKNPFPVTSPLWRKEALITIKGFNEALGLWEDPELHIRAIYSGLRFSVALNGEPDCFYRIDLNQKHALNFQKQHLKKLYKNTYVYYSILAKTFNKKASLNKNLLFNMVSFMQNHIIEKRNLIQFIKFYYLLLKYGLLPINGYIILKAWFLFSVFNIEKIGRYSKDSLRKRLYYLIS